MSNQGFYCTFGVNDPLTFFGTEALPQDGDWFVYIDFIMLTRPDARDGKTVQNYAAENESNASNEEGDEIGLLLVDTGSHADTLLSSDQRDEFLSEFDLGDYSSASIQHVDLWQEGIQWEWGVNEGDQWFIKVTGDLGCTSQHLHVDALQEFQSEDAYIGISVKASGDDPPLFPHVWAGWTIGSIQTMTEDECSTLTA